MNVNTSLQNDRARIGSLPATELAPLDYRYAIDAAMPVISKGTPLLRCHVRPLCAEMSQRVIYSLELSQAEAGLWVEPLEETWNTDLADLRMKLIPGAHLVVIASRPLARFLSERQNWSGRPLGLRLDGLARLTKALRRSGFDIEARFGIHSPNSYALNWLHQVLNRLGCPDLGDFLRFNARLNYCTDSPLQGLSTVALFFARKI